MLGTLQLKSASRLLFIVAILTGTAEANQRIDARQRQMLRRAEVVANRIVRRFHNTLDFKDIFAAEFVAEPKLRSRAVSFNESNLSKRFDAATIERCYVVSMTNLHLWAGYMLVQDVNEVPPDLRDLEKVSTLMGDPNTTPPTTQAEMNRLINEVEKSSAIYRKYLSKMEFRNPTYVENLRRERKRIKTYFHNVPRIENGNERFGIPKSVPVYIVRPEVFDYYFIQEKGKMKLFYINILPNFRLF